MTDFPDYQEPAANAVALSTTNLVGTGLAREAGGNLATHTTLLQGTATGALIGNVGKTVGQEVAALIASGSATGTPGGTPLLHGAAHVFGVTGQVIAASGTFAANNIPFTKPGYLIRISAQMSAAGAVQPTLEANLTWSVNASGSLATASERWFIPCGAAGAVRSNGRGPTKGDSLNILFTNGDTVDSITVSIDVWETTQHMARDDWRSVSAVQSAAGGAIGTQMDANLLASDSFNCNPGVTTTRNLPLYCGQVAVFLNQNTAAGSQVSINPGSIFTTAFIATQVVLDWTVQGHVVTIVNLPRGYCQVLAFNNGAAAVPCAISMIPVEFAS